MLSVTGFRGRRVVIYPNDHRPAHGHVIGRGYEAVFDLNCPLGPPELRENFGFSTAELAKIKTAFVDDLELLCATWRTIHESDQRRV